MQVAGKLKHDPQSDRELAASLPLYAASLVVTLAGIGAVGVTISSNMWLPAFALLTVLGHAVSLALRRARVPAETVFYPVMVFGSILVLQQLVTGGMVAGLDLGIAGQTMDMSTAAVVGSLAVIRCFTLVTDSTLLFSPVPTITMLALVGSANLNAEVPIFFGLFLLGSLFITGYEAHLRRMRRLNRQPGPVLFHLLTSWGMTLGVAVVALLFPLLVQPVLGQFSPFNIPGMNRFRPLTNFTQLSNQRASVGQGPINLSPAPVFNVFTAEGGRLRTAVFSSYSGRDWRSGLSDQQTEDNSERTVVDPPIPGLDPSVTYTRYLHESRPYPDLRRSVAQREVAQRFVTLGPSSQGIPGLGHIRELHYPHQYIYRHLNGCLSGTAHVSSGKTFDVVSTVIEPQPDELRTAEPVSRDTFLNQETLELPQTTRPVQELARRVTGRLQNNYDKVQAILEYIEKNCTYTLQEEVTPPGEDAAAYYLFNTRRGACDLAATAAAVMCRSVDIPARVAVGYVMEEPLPQGGGFLVRQEHAHMWTEVYFPGYGWIPFDAAPPIASIKDHPLQVLWYRITGLFSKIGGGGLDALLLVVVVLGTLALIASWFYTRLRMSWERGARRRRLAGQSAPAAVAVTYEMALAELSRKGWSRPGWMTASEFRDSLRAEWTDHPEAVRAFEELTALFERALYGDQASAADRDAAERARQRLRAAAPRRPKPRPRLAPAPEGAG